jgi:hypothetical protein
LFEEKSIRLIKKFESIFKGPKNNQNALWQKIKNETFAKKYFLIGVIEIAFEEPKSVFNTQKVCLKKKKKKYSFGKKN